MNLDQEKRVMLAFALSIVMLAIYRVYIVKEPPVVPKKPAAVVATTPATTPATGPANPKSASKTATTHAPAPAVLPVSKGAKAEEIVVENSLYRVTLSTVGAVAKSWVLKNYPRGEQVETIDSHACDSLGYPLSVESADEAVKSTANQATYVLSVRRGAGGPSGQDSEELSGNTFAPPVNLTFTYSDGKMQVKKQFSFGDHYDIKASVSVFDGERYLPIEVGWPGGFGDQSLPPNVQAIIEKAAYETVDEAKIREVSLSPSFFGRFLGHNTGNESQQQIPGPLVFAGLEDRYFTGVFLPETPDAGVHLSRDVWTPPNWQGEEKDKPRLLDVSLNSPPGKPLNFRLFVAPKDLGVLRAFHPPLDGLVDFGWFSIVAKPLFICMRYINDHWVHNYGWAIVLLTIIMTAAMFPLKLKSLRSAQEMQRVQPIIKGIQDKYKAYKFNDPRKQKMNEEVMKVYSDHHINPLGSCLPMLLQMPLLYAFYAVLGVSIELRHAPWILWVKDLSAPDRLPVLGIQIPVLVILMTIVSFLLQRMTPMASVDPSQQRMMMLMPLMFGFMFYKLASGMVLYWLTSSLVQMFQQIFINRRMPPPLQPPVPRKSAAGKG